MRGIVLAIALACAARADVTQTATFSDGAYLNLDTGTMSSTAASGTFDIQWSGGAILPVGKAKIANGGVKTSAQFDAVTESDIRTQIGASGVTSIVARTLVLNDSFYCLTNAGNAAKLIVTRVATGILIVNFVVYKALPPGTPTITAVLNNSSLIDSDLPNGGIAPSSLFIVRGTGMADAGQPVLQSTAAPGLPLTLNGASVAVTVNGTTTHPAIYYTTPAQLAAVLPANTPAGTGTLTVTYHGLTSAPFSIRVMPSAPGLNVYGTNSSVATDPATGTLFTFTHSAAPGQTIVLWATGLGADTADSDTTFAASPHSVSTNLQVFFGGVAGQVLYQGSAGYPGVNQINVVVPDSVAAGCWVPVAAVVDNVVSNIATLPVNRGGGECVDAVTGLKGSAISPGGTATFRAGFVSLLLNNSPGQNNTRTVDYISTADFSKYSGLSYDPANSLEPGGCIIRQPQTVIPGVTGLDAGSITLTGPGGLSVAMKNTLGIAGAYNATLSAITPGTYTWTGTGGTAVGSFTSTLNLASPLLTWTNSSAAASVDKTRGLLVTWTGGNPGSLVLITGASILPAGQKTIVASYQCLEHVEAGHFTVPGYITNALPAGQSGSTNVTNLIYFPLSAPGLDIANGLAEIGYVVTGPIGSSR